MISNKKKYMKTGKLKKPKVLIITRFFPEDYKGGGEYVIYNIWKNAKLHYDVRLISGWVNDPKLLPPNTYTVNLKSKNRFIRYFKLYFAVKKYANKIKPDLIHSNAIEVPKLKYKTIVTSHHLGHLLEKVKEKGIINKIKIKIQRIFAKIRYKKFKRIIAVSNSTKNDLIELGINPKKITVVYNGIETDLFKPANKKTKEEKKKFVILYQSRISKEKGQHIAVKALSLLPKEIKDKTKLYLTGFISDKNYLKKVKNMSHGLPIEIMHDLPSKETYFQKSDLFIFPTLMTEGFGLVAAEAFACKLPVIASDFPAVREVVRDNGILVPPNNAKELADAIVKLYKDKKLRKKYAENGRKYVLQNFTWDIAFKKYKEIYDSILGDVR